MDNLIIALLVLIVILLVFGLFVEDDDSDDEQSEPEVKTEIRYVTVPEYAPYYRRLWPRWRLRRPWRRFGGMRRHRRA